MLYLVPSLVLTIIFLKIFIDRLCKTKFFKREESIDSNKKSCIKELHKHKAAVPTMGGIAINLSFLVFTLIYWIINGEFLWLNIILLLFGIMGFIDDYIKIKKLRDGVTPKEKLLGLIMISIIAVLYMIWSKQITTEINLFIYGALLVFIVVASSNSVNITDGLDGLAVGISVIIFLFIGLFAYIKGANDVLFGAAVFEGACLGMLFYNKYPAKIFMGDTGSLLLGGAMAVFIIRLDLPLWTFAMLIVCIFEAASVIMQLFTIKMFNKRIFKIAPFHHHLEKSGWKETKIVYTFWAVTLLFGIIVYFCIAALSAEWRLL